eukprot:COSAG01_NODE_74187_length_224_cov_3.568000_1_plen_51_part_10
MRTPFCVMDTKLTFATPRVLISTAPEQAASQPAAARLGIAKWPLAAAAGAA